MQNRAAHSITALGERTNLWFAGSWFAGRLARPLLRRREKSILGWIIDNVHQPSADLCPAISQEFCV
jgi:hypothetical protein